MDFPANPNPSPSRTHLTDVDPFSLDFEVSEYLMLEGGEEHESTLPSLASPEKNMEGSGGSSEATSRNNNIRCRNGGKKNKMDISQRVAFRTKSQLEVMDDGFKWRKYGKKSVKNSPNPRNYYKCTNEGCSVKKRVERDRDDASYVITTYEGVHNHESPSVVYYNQTPFMVPRGWTLQASSLSSSS